MFEQLALAVVAAQLQVPLIRPLPVPPPAPVEQTDAGKVEVALLPDLVVKEIRVEDDLKMHVLIANEGAAKAEGKIAVDVRGKFGSIRGGDEESVMNLASGESKWVLLRNLYAEDGVRPVSVNEFPLTQVSSFTAHIDDPSRYGPSLVPSMVHSSLLPKRRDCNTDRGCFHEADEANNLRVFEGDAIKRGTPERLIATELAAEPGR